MIGLAMFVLAGFFILAAIYRKHIFNAILTAANTKDPSKSLNNAINTVRNIALADTALDWMGWRKEKQKGDTDLNNLPPRKPSPEDNWSVDPGFFKSETLNPEGPEVWEGQPPAGGTPKRLYGQVPRKVQYEEVDPHGGYQGGGDTWEGQPPEGYPYKQLSSANETSDDSKSINIDTTEAVPVNNNTQTQEKDTADDIIHTEREQIDQKKYTELQHNQAESIVNLKKLDTEAEENPSATTHAEGTGKNIQVEPNRHIEVPHNPNKPELTDTAPGHKIGPETGGKTEDHPPGVKFEPEIGGMLEVEPPEITLMPEIQTKLKFVEENPQNVQIEKIREIDNISEI